MNYRASRRITGQTAIGGQSHSGCQNGRKPAAGSRRCQNTTCFQIKTYAIKIAAVHDLHRERATEYRTGNRASGRPPRRRRARVRRATALDRIEGEFTVAKMLAYDEEARQKLASGVSKLDLNGWGYRWLRIVP